MKLFLTTLFLMQFIASIGHATIYIFGVDKLTGEYGTVVLTSGPIDGENRIIDVKKNQGLFGWGGSSIVGDIDYRQSIVGPAFKAMKAGADIEYIQGLVLKNYGKDWDGDELKKRYRLGFIIPGKGIGYQFASTSPPSAIEDGLIIDENQDKFVIVGGALENKNVLKNAKSYTSNIFKNKSIPLVCKMLLSQLNIAKIGGEKLDFTTAQIVLDDPKQEQLLRVNIFIDERLSEKEILEQLPIRLKNKGFDCTN